MPAAVATLRRHPQARGGRPALPPGVGEMRRFGFRIDAAGGQV